MQRRLSKQMIRHAETEVKKEREYEGDFGTIISTGSTLVDLSISGGRVRGGGLCGGIFVEVFGPPSSGKTVFLSECAGDVQRKGGEATFYDPEARLNEQFAKIFGLEITPDNYKCPDTVTELFTSIRSWDVKTKKGVINGIFADSLAALSTDLEMENDEGDKMGMRRAKEFSEELRKSCRILAKKNYLMIASNQVRINTNAGPYGQKYITPGGEAIAFYASLRLKFSSPEEIVVTKKMGGREIKKTIGTITQVKVFKSSVWQAFHIAPLYIVNDYGIDDVRANLQFIKNYTSNKVYSVNGHELDISMDKSIRMVEDDDLVDKLKEQTINLWEEIESKFSNERKPKR